MQPSTVPFVSSGRAGVSNRQGSTRARALRPALRGGRVPREQAGGDLDEKDRLLGVLVTLVQRREHHELVSGLLWLGLWPGLDAVYRRRQRNFRGQPEELIAELADAFTGIIERLDLEVVHRVAATLVRSTARDLIDRRRRVWADADRIVYRDTFEPVRDQDDRIIVASHLDRLARAEWEASTGGPRSG